MNRETLRKICKEVIINSLFRGKANRKLPDPVYLGFPDNDFEAASALAKIFANQEALDYCEEHMHYLPFFHMDKDGRYWFTCSDEKACLVGWDLVSGEAGTSDTAAVYDFVRTYITESGKILMVRAHEYEFNPEDKDDRMVINLPEPENSGYQPSLYVLDIFVNPEYRGLWN